MAIEEDLGQTLVLDAALDPALCGHKAATLAELRKLGHTIPDGFVIPVGTSCSPAVLSAALARLGPGPYAVRSSGVAEDLSDASFAGQYETILGVSTVDDVLAATERVRASGGAEHVAAYRAHVAGEGAPLGVLVQRLVAADAAGVMFSANPVTGDDEVVIEAVSGLGDRLVSGDAEGDRWIDDGTLTAFTDSGVIDAALARRLAELARRIARERGCPQDIEWAVADGEIHVLQARPITGLPLKPVIEIPPGRWMKDTSHFPGPMTHVGASILLPVLEAGFVDVFAEFGLPMGNILQRSFGGEIYTQDVDIDGRHDASAAPPWWVLAIVVRLVPSMRRRLKAAEAALAKLNAYPRLWESTWKHEVIERIDAARSVNLEPLTDDELIDELSRVIDEVLLPGMVIHFQLTIPHMVGVAELITCCQELLGWNTYQAMDLLAGLSSATMTPAHEMAAIAADLDDEVIAEGLDAVRKTSVGPRLTAWCDRWGLRAIDSDPGTAMIRERDDLVLGLLRQARERSNDVEQRRQRCIEQARAALSGSELERFDAALAYAEIVYPQREDNTQYTEGMGCGLVRRVLLEIGARLTTAGVIQAPGDVSFLEREELRPALIGALQGESAADRVRRRRAERAWVLAHPGPFVHGPPPVPNPDMRGLPAAARRITSAVLVAVAEELAPPEVKEQEGAVSGIAASPGTYTGKVRVIRTESELERLLPGEVLVCPTTHSGWAVVFSRAGALVTDGGGILSHPSIIAREHDIPAVVATGCATKTLRDGQTVTVDGATGHVRIH